MKKAIKTTFPVQTKNETCYLIINEKNQACAIWSCFSGKKK